MSERSVQIPRLEIEVKGVDPAVVRAALDLLPAQLGEQLRGRAGAAPGSTLQVTQKTDAATLARLLARQVAAEVQARTPPPARNAEAAAQRGAPGKEG